MSSLLEKSIYLNKGLFIYTILFFLAICYAANDFKYEVKKEISKNIFLVTNTRNDLSIINAENVYLVYGAVLEYRDNSDFIIVAERPREKVAKCNQYKVTIRACDEAFKKSGFVQYWIIYKKDLTTFGPIEKREYRSVRNILGVDKNLQLHKF